MVEVDGVGVNNDVAVGCHGVDVFVDLTGVEEGVMVVADSEGDDVSGRRLKAASTAH